MGVMAFHLERLTYSEYLLRILGQPLVEDFGLEGERADFLDDFGDVKAEVEPVGAEEHFVLNSCVAEMEQHFPAAAGLREILGAICGYVKIEVFVAPGERDYLVDPRPAAVARDKLQAGEPDADIVEIDGPTVVHSPLRRPIDRGMYPDGHA